MSKPCIADHFENLGAPLANHYWSWGAMRPADGTVILRVWADERCQIDGQWYRRLLEPSYVSSLGYGERLEHIQKIRDGSPGYMVILTAADPKAAKRKIAAYNESVLVPIGRVVDLADGSVWGECLKPVPVKFLGLSEVRP